ncbi:MAG: DegT/DnrJ/EryC1/StrS family aminotransferase [Burkholderiales bacterium]|nr:DegT/DnrJ/EryC1/StrS family aminotransferase [Burkholderiales bacterium]
MTNTVRFPLASTTWGPEEYAAIQGVINSGQFSMAQKVAQFESEFAAYSGTKHAVMVNSGSSANLLMTAALCFTKNKSLQLFRGDEVIVPAVSWSTTFYPLAQYGLKLRFVDIDLHTLNYDLDALEAAITPSTRAIMVVNLLGNPNDFDRLKQIADKHNLYLIEDNCESLGASYKGRLAGTFGVMGTYSFFFSHHISTMEGGMVTTDDEELYHVMLCLRAHGWTRNLPKINHVTGVKSDDPFEESFKFVLPGYNLRPLEMEAALGTEQLKKLPFFVEQRRSNAKLFVEAMSEHPDLLIQREIGESSWFGFSLTPRPNSSLDRRTLVQKLNTLGFECRPIVTGNFAKNPVLQHFDHSIPFPLSNADHIDQSGLFIGNHHFPMNEAIDALKQI